MPPATNPFFGKVAREYDVWYTTPWGAFADARQRALFLRMAHPNPGERALDVGCGTGRYIEWLCQLGLDVFGLDISPDMLDVASRRLREADLPARLVLADATRIPFRDATFDLAYAVTTLEFIPDPAGAIREMARVARRIFIGVLNRRSRLFRQQSRRRGPLSDAHWFDPDEFVTLLRGALPGWRLDFASCLHWGRFSSPGGHWFAALTEIFVPSSRLTGGFLTALARPPSAA